MRESLAVHLQMKGIRVGNNLRHRIVGLRVGEEGEGTGGGGGLREGKGPGGRRGRFRRREGETSGKGGGGRIVRKGQEA